MANLSTILNLVLCGLSAVLGTGTKGCKPFFKKVTSIWLTPQGFEFDSNVALDSTYIKSLQAQGKLIILKGIRTFTDNTPDDTIDELEDGTKNVAKLGLYEFAVKFVNGLYFHAAVHSLNSFGTYDATFIDRDGNILGTKSTTGGLKGFTVGMIQGMKFEWATDAQAQREGFGCQLLERSEFDRDYVFIDNGNLDFNPNRLDGINECVVSFPSVPSAGTSVAVKVALKQGGGAVTGLDHEDFLMTKGGATSNPTGGDDSVLEGTYVFTVPAFVLDDDLTARIYDTANNRGVIEVSPDLYKSNIATATAV